LHLLEGQEIQDKKSFVDKNSYWADPMGLHTYDMPPVLVAN